MTGQRDSLGAAESGARHDRVAIAVHGQVRQRRESASDGVRERPLIATDRLDVHELGGHFGGGPGKIQFHAASIAVPPAGPPSPARGHERAES